MDNIQCITEEQKRELEALKAEYDAKIAAVNTRTHYHYRKISDNAESTPLIQLIEEYFDKKLKILETTKE